MAGCEGRTGPSSSPLGWGFSSLKFHIKGKETSAARRLGWRARLKEKFWRKPEKERLGNDDYAWRPRDRESIESGWRRFRKEKTDWGLEEKGSPEREFQTAKRKKARLRKNWRVLGRRDYRESEEQQKGKPRGKERQSVLIWRAWEESNKGASRILSSKHWLRWWRCRCWCCYFSTAVGPVAESTG